MFWASLIFLSFPFKDYYLFWGVCTYVLKHTCRNQRTTFGSWVLWIEGRLSDLQTSLFTHGTYSLALEKPVKEG